MKYAEINKRFTEIVAEYINKGYLVNSSSMGGSQGETAKIDLTNGTEIIRVMICRFSEWNPHSVEGVEITVGRAVDDDIVPHNASGLNTIWNNRLEVVEAFEAERFYVLGEDRRNGPYYGTKEEAYAATELRVKRYIARNRDRKTENITDKVMEIAKRIIRREFGVKRICEADITVSKYNGAYTVGYKGKAYRLR